MCYYGMHRRDIAESEEGSDDLSLPLPQKQISKSGAAAPTGAQRDGTSYERFLAGLRRKWRNRKQHQTESA